MFILVYQVGQLGPTGSELLGDVTPSFAGVFAVWLIEGLPDRGRNVKNLSNNLDSNCFETKTANSQSCF